MSEELNRTENLPQTPKKSKAKTLQFPIKIGDEELFEELKAVVDRSGEFEDREDWVRYILQLMKLQDQRVAAQKYDTEIRDFEKHSKRLVEVFNGMVSRIMDSEEEYGVQLADKTELVSTQQGRILTLTEKLDLQEKETEQLKEKYQQHLEEEKELANDKKKHLEERVEELQRELSKSAAFSEQQTITIKDLQKRIMEKDEDLSQFKGLQKENEALKNNIHQIREQYSSIIDDLKSKLTDKDQDNRILYERMSLIGLEKDQEILKLKIENQEQLAKANEEYNIRVRELLNELHNGNKEEENKGN